MKADRNEAITLLKQPKQRKEELVRLEQAALEKQQLLNDPKWDIYLQEIQSWIKTTKEHLTAFQAQLDSPELTDPTEVQRLRNRIFVCNERIGTLNLVIDLPKQVIELGEKAKLKLEEIGEEIIDKNSA